MEVLAGVVVAVVGSDVPAERREGRVADPLGLCIGPARSNWGV
ncbi:MAG TPA: hypothetical protein VMF65_23955 [Acidimicrobiales bacterium]|nr:hypothetical protein [Acidimicrobiales bacterium]